MVFQEQLAKHIEKDFLHRHGVQRVKRGAGFAYAVGDEVFAFLSDDGVVLRLDEPERGALLHTPNARPFTSGHTHKEDELVELVIENFMDMMTGMEWVRRAYSSAAKRAAAAKGHHRGLSPHS
jgi:hypothetical protein